MSEYIQSLVRRERQRKADYAARPTPQIVRGDDFHVVVDALEQVEKLKAIVKGKDRDDD